MKTRAFLKGLSWLILLNLLVKPVWIFFIDRQVQLTVGNVRYGQYFALLNLSYVLIFLADAGLTNLLNQSMAVGRRLPRQRLLRLKAVLLLLYVTACCFIAWLTDVRQTEVLFYILAVQVLTSFFVFLRGTITAGQYFTADAGFSVIDKTLMVLLCGALLYTSAFGEMTLLRFLKIQTLCTGLAVAGALVFIRKKNLLQGGDAVSEESLLPALAPFAAIILLMSVHYRLDGFLLERIHHRGAAEAGTYAAAYRLLDAGNMIGYLAASFLVPFVARNRADRTALTEVVFNTRHALLIFSIGLVGFVASYAPLVQEWLYHHRDPYSARVLQCCVAALPGYYLVHIYGSLLVATERFRAFLYILVVCVSLNILLNLLLIPTWGALGCCYAALASEYLCGILLFFTAHRKLELPYGYRSLAGYGVLLAVLISLFSWGKAAGTNVWIILAIAVCISLLFLTAQLRVFKKYFVSLR